MKKALSLILALSLIVSLAFSLISCQNDDADDNGSSIDGEYSSVLTFDGVPLKIVVDGKEAYFLMIPDGADEEFLEGFEGDAHISVFGKIPFTYDYDKKTFELTLKAEEGTMLSIKFTIEGADKDAAKEHVINYFEEQKASYENWGFNDEQLKEYVAEVDSYIKAVKSGEFTEVVDAGMPKLEYTFRLDTEKKTATPVSGKEFMTDDDGNAAGYSMMKFDEAGNILEEFEYDVDDKLVEKTVYEYYENGYPKSEKSYDENGKLFYSCDRYEDGSIKSQKNYDKNGEITYSYDYDEDGNLIDSYDIDENGIFD